MNKKYPIGLIIILAIMFFFIVLKPSSREEVPNNQVAVKDHKNTSYTIEGRSTSLVDGKSEIESAPGSTSKTITRYFGNEIMHDLNDDGLEDVVFLITQEQGGSGQFFYAVAALNSPTGYIGSNAFLLGDRISPQSLSINEGTTTQGTTRKNVIVVNFAIRKPGEPLTSKPTVGKSIWIKLDPATMQFGEVVQDFEGESR